MEDICLLQLIHYYTSFPSYPNEQKKYSLKDIDYNKLYVVEQNVQVFLPEILVATVV